MAASILRSASKHSLKPPNLYQGLCIVAGALHAWHTEQNPFPVGKFSTWIFDSR